MIPLKMKLKQVKSKQLNSMKYNVYKINSILQVSISLNISFNTYQHKQSARRGVSQAANKTKFSVYFMSEKERE